MIISYIMLKGVINGNIVYHSGWTTSVLVNIWSVVYSSYYFDRRKLGTSILHRIKIFLFVYYDFINLWINLALHFREASHMPWDGFMLFFCPSSPSNAESMDVNCFTITIQLNQINVSWYDPLFIIYKDSYLLHFFSSQSCL